MIYKSVIVILSPWNPSKVPLEDLAYEADKGDCICTSQTVEVATPDDICKAGDFFFPEAYSGNDYGEEPDWVDSHSVNCYICNDLFDERNSIGTTNDGGDVCPKHVGDPRIKED